MYEKVENSEGYTFSVWILVQWPLHVVSLQCWHIFKREIFLILFLLVFLLEVLEFIVNFWRLFIPEVFNLRSLTLWPINLLSELEENLAWNLCFLDVKFSLPDSIKKISKMVISGYLRVRYRSIWVLGYALIPPFLVILWIFFSTWEFELLKKLLTHFLACLTAFADGLKIIDPWSLFLLFTSGLTPLMNDFSVKLVVKSTSECLFFPRWPIALPVWQDFMEMWEDFWDLNTDLGHLQSDLHLHCFINDSWVLWVLWGRWDVIENSVGVLPRIVWESFALLLHSGDLNAIL